MDVRGITLNTPYTDSERPPQNRSEHDTLHEYANAPTDSVLFPFRWTHLDCSLAGPVDAAGPKAQPLAGGND